MKKLLLVIDMQNDFVDGALGTKEAQKILPSVVEKVKRARAEGTELIFTQDTHTIDYLDTPEGKKLPVAHCIKPTEGWEICSELQDYAKEAICVEKPTFGGTALIKLVETYDDILLVGLCTDICVISNALLLKSFYPNKKISVDKNCCAGVTPETHANALSVMQMCQIDIVGA